MQRLLWGFILGISLVSGPAISGTLEDCVEVLYRRKKIASVEVERTQLQQSIIDYIDEVRREAKVWSNESHWPLYAILRSPYIRNTLTIMNRNLLQRMDTMREVPDLDPRVLASGELLHAYTDKTLAAFEQRGLPYQHFVKLAHVYAIHFGMLGDNADFRESILKAQLGTSYYLMFGLRRPRLLTPSLLLRKESNLTYYLDTSWILDDYHQYKGVLSRNAKYKIDQFGYAGHHFVLIPSMANLGFETILMAQGHHAGFLGLATQPMSVDGAQYYPLSFFYHDVNHNLENGRISNDKLVADAVMAGLQATKASDLRNYKIAVAYLFYLTHERVTSMNCSSMMRNFASTGHAISANMASGGRSPRNDRYRSHISYELRGFESRLNTNSDLGAAFPDHLPDQSEILRAYGTIRSVVHAICK